MSINSVNYTQTSSANARASAQAASQAAAAEQATASNSIADKNTPSAVVELGTNNGQKATYGRPKGLSSDQLKQLQDSQSNQQTSFLKNMMQGILQNQAQQYGTSAQLNFSGVLVNASAFNLPAVGTTPAEAAAKIAEGGDYSVDAVATRIFSLAETIANGDPERLQTMRNAVNKGFEQAGLAFKSATKSGLPQICNDTYDEIMKRFDALEEKLNKSEEKPAQTTMPE